MASSGFEFVQGNERLDWGVLVAIDVHRLLKDVNVDTLQRIVENLAFARVTRDEAAMFTPEHILHLFQLFQLVIQYLVYSQECLAKMNVKLNDKVTSLLKEVKNLDEAKRLLLEEGAVLKKEVKAQRRTLMAYEFNAASGGYKPSCKTEAALPTMFCPSCGEGYHKIESLQSHIRKRHGNASSTLIPPLPQQQNALPSPLPPQVQQQQSSPSPPSVADAELLRIQERVATLERQIEKEREAADRQQRDYMMNLLLMQNRQLPQPTQSPSTLQAVTPSATSPPAAAPIPAPAPEHQNNASKPETTVPLPASQFSTALPGSTVAGGVTHTSTTKRPDSVSTIPVMPDLSAMTEYNITRQRETANSALLTQMLDLEKRLAQTKKQEEERKKADEERIKKEEEDRNAFFSKLLAAQQQPPPAPPPPSAATATEPAQSPAAAPPVPAVPVPNPTMPATNSDNGQPKPEHSTSPLTVSTAPDLAPPSLSPPTRSPLLPTPIPIPQVGSSTTATAPVTVPPAPVSASVSEVKPTSWLSAPSITPLSPPTPTPPPPSVTSPTPPTPITTSTTPAPTPATMKPNTVPSWLQTLHQPVPIVTVNRDATSTASPVPLPVSVPAPQVSGARPIGSSGSFSSSVDSSSTVPPNRASPRGPVSLDSSTAYLPPSHLTVPGVQPGAGLSSFPTLAGPPTIASTLSAPPATSPIPVPTFTPTPTPSPFATSSYMLGTVPTPSVSPFSAPVPMATATGMTPVSSSIPTPQVPGATGHVKTFRALSSSSSDGEYTY